MPPVLPLTVEPIARTGFYKHMAKRDAAVWGRFLEQFGAAFLGVAYDVALGGIAPGPEIPLEADRRMWQYSTALKVDAVLFGVESVVLIEVRPYATVSALGAALCYTLVAEREQLSDLPLQAGIVCEALQLDVEWACRRLNVAVWKV